MSEEGGREGVRTVMIKVGEYVRADIYKYIYIPIRRGCCCWK